MIKPKDNNVGMEVLSKVALVWGFEGLDEKREGVEIGVYVT